MINQQLVDFIKQQLQVGLTKEKISSELLANGWNTQDIEEGFKATGIPIPPAPAPASIPPAAPVFATPILNPTPITTQSLNPNLYPHFDDTKPAVAKVKQSGKGLFLIILIILFLLAGGASAYYFKDSLLKLPIIKDFFPSKEAVVPEVPTQTDNTQAVTQAQQPDNTNTSVTNIGYQVTDPYNSLEQCNSLSGDKLHLCYIEVVVTTKDDSLCETITTQSDKNSCYALAALVKNDSSLCIKAGDLLGNCKFMALLELPNTDPKNCNSTDVQAKEQCISSANALQKVMPLVEERANQGKLPNLNLTMVPNNPLAGQNITITAEVTGLVTGEKVANINFMVVGENTSVAKAPYEATFKIAEDAKGEQIYPVQLLTNTGIYVMKNIVFNL